MPRCPVAGKWLSVWHAHKHCCRTFLFRCFDAINSNCVCVRAASFNLVSLRLHRCLFRMSCTMCRSNMFNRLLHLKSRKKKFEKTEETTVKRCFTRHIRIRFRREKTIGNCSTNLVVTTWTLVQSLCTYKMPTDYFIHESVSLLPQRLLFISIHSGFFSVEWNIRRRVRTWCSIDFFQFEVKRKTIPFFSCLVWKIFQYFRSIFVPQ